MKYFKNVELARLYKVSERTIGNWIEAAQEGKIDLHLHDSENRKYISNTSHNHVIMKELSEKGKKFKNRNAFKQVKPLKEFYELFNHNQIIDIVTNLQIYKEIPHQFAYFDGGARYWDEYSCKLITEKTSNAFTNTIQLLSLNSNYIESLVANTEKINVIDVGPGNCLPVKDFLNSLLIKDLLNKYIAIDYSQDMLDIAKNNITNWFGNKIVIEDHIKDINFDRFRDILLENANHNKNLILLLGGTIANQRLIDKPFGVLNSSMGLNDILVYTSKLDSEKSRRYFDFSSNNSSNMDIIEKERIVLDLLGILPEFYSVEQYYDEKIKSRIIQISLKLDIEITVDINGLEYSIQLRNHDKVILWRAIHQTYMEVTERFDKNGFEILHTSRSNDLEQILVIAKIKNT